jgi:hypothetical protein
MKLLTKAIKKKLPKLYKTDGQGDEAMVQAKFFCPWNQWTWYAIEFDGTDSFFGFVVGDNNELGYFSLAELKSINGPWGLKIERDKYFSASKLACIRKIHS